MSPSANTYTLKHPITLETPIGGGQTAKTTVTEVALSRPKGKQLRAMDTSAGKMGQALAIIGAVCRLTPTQVDEMDAEDIVVLAERVADFFPDLQAIGGTSSGT